MKNLTMPGPPKKTKPDPHQATVIRFLEEEKRKYPDMWITNLKTGFYASSADVAKLKKMIEEQLSDKTPEDVGFSWATVDDWLQTVIHHWVQRVKIYKANLRGDRIQVQFTTKDDAGEYNYLLVVRVGVNVSA